MKIIGGPSSQTLACRVAAQLNILPTVTNFERFPDNEHYIKILDDVAGEDVVLIQSTTTDSDLIALLQLIDACAAAKSIRVVIPYFGYARQDQIFKAGEAVSARAMARTIQGVDSVWTINLHKKYTLEHFTCPAEDLDVSPLIGKYLSELNLARPLLVAPDKGVEQMVRTMAQGLALECDVFDKTRLSGDTVVIQDKKMDIAGRDIILMDDMIATGGTMAESVKLLRSNGARDIYVACVHPVLTRNAVLRLANAGVKDIIATDTLEKIQSAVSVAPIIADKLKNI
ncbi:Ribose-phosphate pyrophosphokinase [Methanosarcinaceae archaeon Ag5]|uniref:Ribose-phosphate pyrophosphokinase n=1 Tax=Methanolapillus africanus TaxID=3028297 RepID=A0AAE4MHC4_9EURY|nr:Ribose-phosphate pyrophosphokinase [Methanosarcinaceae archaeon Ag5]